LRENIELKTDKPLDIAFDETEGKQFLKCDYNHCYNNQDGNSYRSPWTNKYFPNVQVDPSNDDQPMYPSQELLEMEQKANEVFQRYAKLYYDMNYLTSVYFFDAENNGFGSCWLIKKTNTNECGMDSGNWDAIHLVTTNIDANNKAKYRLVSAVFLRIKASNDAQGKMEISNQVNKTREQIYNLDQSIDGADL